ncbi:MAG: ATP-dependent Clp protease ATP-binding subunit [Candidatus Daviesbacteria bacterium]|nr:ATP-dependent Clp protease ATP-binding subunit [Candidatus Daviesbacteria bacterium]
MHYLRLPLDLIKFWFVDSLVTLTRTWKNLILYLEEDLAVGLMWRLLFVPLYHDSSIVGRFLSLIFRSIRIIIGLFAFALSTIAMLIISLYWLTSPVLIFLPQLRLLSLVTVFVGVGLFLIHHFSHPSQKIWQTKDLWLSSRLKKSKLNITYLLRDEQVKLLLDYLEIKPENFTDFQIADSQKIGEMAYNLAKTLGSEYLDARHFFLSVLEANPNLEKVLLKLNLEKNDLTNTFKYLELRQRKWRKIYLWDADFTVTHLRGVNRGWLGVPTPVLDTISVDLTREASRGGSTDFFGHAGTLSSVVDVLSSQNLKNVVLVGPAGSGKTTLISSLAKQIVTGNAPPALSSSRIVQIDFTKLLAGVETQGDLAQKVKSSFEEAQFAGGIILVMEEIHFVALGQVGTEFNLYALISPYLEFSHLQFIATTETENYSAILEKNSVFARLFTKVVLPPTTQEETLDILLHYAINLERKNKIRVSFISLKKVAALSSTYIHDRVLPDSAISILDESVTHAKDKWITAKSIEEIFGARVNIPVTELGNVQKDKLLNLENVIHERLIDQEEAVKKVADTLRRGAANLRESARPIGSFLFVGPTGVGKTELAKILSEVFFEKDSFIRFDMSEYQNENSVDRLIQELSESVKNKPYSLILLDEFEKADPKILTLFLQVLEDGRLTENDGKTVDFTNTIIIATSNAGSLTIAKGLENKQNIESLDKQVRGELLQIFKPELINRFDEVVLFKPLSQGQLQQIVTIKLQELKNTLKKQGYVVEFSPEIVSSLAQKGYDPVLGARPLRRLIQDSLEANLSKMILEGKLLKGERFTAGNELLT